MKNATCLVTSILFMLTWSCSPSMENNIHSEQITQNDKRNQAENYLHEFVESNGGQINHYNGVYLPTGEFLFLRASVKGKSHLNTLSKKIAVYPDGSIQDLILAEKTWKNNFKERWGSFSFEVARRELISFYDNKKQHEFTIQTSSDFQEKELGLNTHQVLYDSYSNESRLIGVNATFDEIKKLKFHPKVYKISVGEGPEDSKKINNTVNNETPAHYTLSDIYFNDRMNNYAKGIGVGLWEVGMSNSNAIREDHEAFEFANIIYRHPSKTQSCTFDKDCDAIFDPDRYESICENVDGERICVNKHATKVASRISMSVNGNPNHAAEANIFIDNDVIPRVTSSSNKHTLEWFYSQHVDIVNMSFGYDENKYHEWNDDVYDWWSRYRGMLLVKSAGNHSQSGGVSTLVTGCHALNVLCVGAAKANNSYGENEFGDDELAASQYFESKWVNPLYGYGHMFSGDNKDAERPDVISEGYRTHVALPSTRSFYSVNISAGTSLSAPTVAGLAALFKKCRIENGSYFSPLEFRSLIKTSSRQPHNLDSSSTLFYSTPGTGHDFKTGAGIPTADNLSKWCSTEANRGPNDAGNGSLTEINELNWDGSGEPIPDYFGYGGQPIENITIGESHEFETVRKNALLSDLKTKTRRALFAPIDFPNGGRVRMTASFFSCPSGATTLAPANDLDLVLCSDTQQACYGMSESMDDTNEGFDVSIPPKTYGLTPYIVGPNAAYISLCMGASNDPVITTQWVDVF
jgi:hypothetical protein